MVGPSKALQTCCLLKVHPGENRKGMAWPLPRKGPSLLHSTGLILVWLPTIHLFRQENSLHIQALLDACLISSLLFCSLMGQEIKSQRREILLWSRSLKNQGLQEREFLWAFWLYCPVSGVLLFLFCEVETTSSIKWDVLTFCLDRLSLQID